MTSTFARPFSVVAGCCLAAGLARADGPQFESPPVHPVELAEDGSRLFALHQADHRLVIFDLDGGGLPARTAEIFVGLEPVSVRERTPGEVWVVNHLSDSISIVDTGSGRIVRTLLVGDEPTDVVFAGTPERAFVCVSQEDVIRVYDPADLSLPPVEVPLTQSDPLALAVSPDGQTVYVAALDSGNQTTVVPFEDVEAGGGPPPPSPPMSTDLPPAPRTALIVEHDGGSWRDESGTSWDPYVGYTLLDHDVLAIDASSLSIVSARTGIGTTLLGIAVNPADGRVYVSNQEALNLVRFEVNLKGDFVRNRVTVLGPGPGPAVPVHLNPHIDYSQPEGTEAERSQSLSIPNALAVSADGSAVYVSAFGSAKVGVLDGAGVLQRRIEVGDGPCGLVLDETRGRLYVLQRIPGALGVVDLTDDSVTEIGLGFDPTPEEIHDGRRRFYDGRLSSAHGDVSCASCHVYGDMDKIAWDLGDPEGEFIEGLSGAHSGFHPMKGPLMTQSLKSLPGTEPFHWRGDRLELSDFNGAFVSLLGRSGELTVQEFSEFEDFVFSLAYPPNPNRNLDGSLPDPSTGPNPTTGEDLFRFGRLASGSDCTACHTFPTGENGNVVPFVLLNHDQDMVVPQLRNLHEKTRFDDTAPTNVRGYGYRTDGTVDDLVSFLEFPRFDFDSETDREHVAAFLLAFDSAAHAAVGAQWTMNGTNEAEGLPRLTTLVSVSDQSLIGLVAKGRDLAGDERGWVYESGSWRPDRLAESPVTLSELLAVVGPGRELTFTAVYPGCELRLGVDRDLDGFLDRDELDAGSDPGDPGSTPETSSTPDPAGGTEDAIRGGALPQLDPIWPNPANRSARIAYRVPGAMPVSVVVFDVSGRQVRTIVEGEVAVAGRYDAIWNLQDDAGQVVPAGLYFVRLAAGDEVTSKRVVVRR